jgi:glycosyltransferase involved in cell wall biosynthesis
MKNNTDFQVSVIIPTHNRKILIERAIQSVLKQTYPPAEIMIIDDGSTDGTDQLIKRKYPGLKHLQIEHNGVSNARNVGIENSSCNWIAFLDSDDEWLANKLEKQIRELTQRSGYKICHTNELWIRKGKRVNPRLKHQKYGGMIFEKCLPLCVISPSSVIIHRSVFMQYGTFDASLPVCEDYDLWLRLCAFLPVLYIHEPLIIKYGGHKDQLSHSIWGIDRFRIQALEKIIHHTKLDNKYKIAAIKMILKKISIYINGAEKRKKRAETDIYIKMKERYRQLLDKLTAITSTI